MVHALEEVHRVLRQGGILVDMRPVVSNPYVEVLREMNVTLAGRLDDSADLPDTQASDQAVATTLKRGWFHPLEEDSTSFAYYWDTAEEVRRHIQDNWPEAILPEEVYQQAKQLAEAAGPNSKLRITFPMMIKTYRNQK